MDNVIRAAAKELNKRLLGSIYKKLGFTNEVLAGTSEHSNQSIAVAIGLIEGQVQRDQTAGLSFTLTHALYTMYEAVGLKRCEPAATGQLHNIGEYEKRCVDLGEEPIHTLGQLRELIDARRSFGGHPLWQRIGEGGVDTRGLRLFALQFFLLR